MNVLLIVTVTFSTLVFLIIQIRFIRRFIRIRSNHNHLPGVLFLAEAVFEGCCCALECCAETSTDLSQDRVDILGGEHLEKYSGKPPEEYEIQLALDEKKKTGKSYQSSEEEQNKVKELLSKRQKTSIMYLCNIASLPKQRVIVIILADPDYIIEDEYVINKKFVKDDIKTQEMKRIEEKITKGICPACDTLLEPSWEFCANCGYVLK